MEKDYPLVVGNGYTYSYNNFWKKWQVSHDVIGACIAEFNTEKEAIEYIIKD